MRNNLLSGVVMLLLGSLVCIAAITTLGCNANNTFSNVAGKAVPESGARSAPSAPKDGPWVKGEEPPTRPVESATKDAASPKSDAIAPTPTPKPAMDDAHT